jgi:cytochrome P450
LLALLEFPEQMADLRANPDIFPMAVEELIRFDGPARATVRLVKEDHEYAGVKFTAGERVFIANPAANHDPRVFENPGQLNLRRNPTNHMGFGFGLHFCLGAPLARLEVELALGALMNKFSRIEMACTREELSWHPTMLSRGLHKLPVILHH